MDDDAEPQEEHGTVNIGLTEPAPQMDKLLELGQTLVGLGAVKDPAVFLNFPYFLADIFLRIDIDTGDINEPGVFRNGIFHEEDFERVVESLTALLCIQLDSRISLLRHGFKTKKKEHEPLQEGISAIIREQVKSNLVEYVLNMTSHRAFELAIEHDLITQEICDILSPVLSERFDEYQSEFPSGQGDSPNLFEVPSLIERRDDDLVTDAILGAIASRHEAITVLEDEMSSLVAQARERNTSWQKIADASGMQRSGAYKRWDQDAKEKNRKSQQKYMDRLRGDTDAEDDA